MRAVKHALISVAPGSIEMNCGLQSGVGNVYSLNVPVPGKKTNTLFLADSVPNKASDPDIMVNAKPVGFELGVGIVHCWKVSVDGSRWVTLLPADSTNQQQSPDGSNAKLVGRLSGVGIVHSVRKRTNKQGVNGLASSTHHCFVAIALIMFYSPFIASLLDVFLTGETTSMIIVLLVLLLVAFLARRIFRLMDRRSLWNAIAKFKVTESTST